MFIFDRGIRYEPVGAFIDHYKMEKLKLSFFKTRWQLLTKELKLYVAVFLDSLLIIYLLIIPLFLLESCFGKFHPPLRFSLEVGDVCVSVCVTVILLIFHFLLSYQSFNLVVWVFFNLT